MTLARSARPRSECWRAWLARGVVCCVAFACVDASRDSSAGEPTPVAVARPLSTTTAELLRIVVVADLEGVVEPCGCTERTGGGLDRLSAAVTALRASPGPLVLVVAGNALSSPAAAVPARQQDGWSADVVEAVLTRLRPHAIAAGPSDLSLHAQRVAHVARASGAVLVGETKALDRTELPQSAAETALFDSAGTAIGIVTAGEEAAGTARATKAVADLRRRGTEVVLVVVRGRWPSQPELGADVVIQTGTASDDAPRAIEHHGQLWIRPGRHGQSLHVLELANGLTRSARARELRLDPEVGSDPAVRTLMQQHFARVNAHNTSTAPPAPAPRPDAPNYVGSRTCAACHTQAYFWWRTTKHGRAFESLTERRRELDLDCIGCHVTGYGEPGGASVGNHAELEGVGCESCHGPGGHHVDDPRPSPRSVRRAVPDRLCLHCHDREHSDAFDASAARTALLVHGHGLPSSR